MRRRGSRRELLKFSVLTASTLPTACYNGSEREAVLSAQESERFFPQSLASGDPRPESVVLWVRVEDPERADQDLALELELSLDPEFQEPLSLPGEAAQLLASLDADHCVRLRVEALTPATTYYYRFSYRASRGLARTRVGRTRTAPAPDADVPARFAVLCCQDYVGKYFHVHRHISEQDVDFVLHLGDYVYETAGDPSFQSPTAARAVRFSAPEEALALGGGAESYLAAQSLSNYRDLYKLYRSDPDLQALHERHPIVAIWDDHEFSDDCYGDVATYQDGRVDEASPARRAAADQAWFEYMPVDYQEGPAQELDANAAPPDNFRIYRSFLFGRHLELVLTDLRRFRPDHLVPEGAAPGSVYMTQDEVEATLDALPPDLVPYVDIDDHAAGAYAEALRGASAELDISPEKLSGKVSAVWINQALASLSAAELPEPIDLDDPELERGYAYHCLLKTSEFTAIGSRYVVALGPFEALAKRRFIDSEGESERLMGEAQRRWFLDTIASSRATFKLWASEVALQPRHIDLTGVGFAPPELQTRISISAEDWDGFPNERRELLGALAEAGNVLILSGDLHCFFAGTPFVDGEPETRVVELTTGSASSTTWLDAIEGSLARDGSIPMNASLLVQNIGVLLADDIHRPNPHLAFQELGRHGYSVIEVSEDEVVMTLRTISVEDVATPPAELSGELDEHFAQERFRTRAGTRDLEREIDGEFLTWNLEAMEFQ